MGKLDGFFIFYNFSKTIYFYNNRDIRRQRKISPYSL